MGRLVAFLLDALVLFFIIRTVVRLVTGPRPPQRASRPASPPERAGGTLVRDPQCGTYVPESRAIRVGSGDRTLYFCSTTCRDAYERRT
jgi:uncharacterized protein